MLMENTLSKEKLKKMLSLEHITIKPYLSLEETILFVQEVVESCFTTIKDENGNNITKFTPYYKDFSIWVSTLIFYIKEFNYSTESDFEKIYELFLKEEKGSSVLEVLYPFINTRQYNSILISVDEMIGFEKQKMLNEKSKEFENVVLELKSFIENIQNAIGEVSAEAISMKEND